MTRAYVPISSFGSDTHERIVGHPRAYRGTVRYPPSSDKIEKGLREGGIFLIFKPNSFRQNVDEMNIGWPCTQLSGTDYHGYE